MRRCPLPHLLLLGLLDLLASCVTAPRPSPAAAAAAPAVLDLGKPGRIAAVREVDITPGAGSRAGVDAVLAALQQPASPATVSLQEIVINQPGGDPVSIGGAYPGFTAGNRVSLTAGPTTLLTHGE